MRSIEAEYEGQWIHVDTHVSGEFFFSEVIPHRMRHEVGPIPHVQFDGIDREIGANDCEADADRYRAILDARIAQTSLLSPIDLSTELSVATDSAVVMAEVELVDDINLPPLLVTHYLLEDDVSWCCDSQGGSSFDRITRAVTSQTIDLEFETAQSSRQAWAMDPDWNPENLWAVSVVENADAPREVHQSAEFRDETRVSLDNQVRALPLGSGIVETVGVLTNGNEFADQFSLTITTEAGWTAEFRLAGGASWTDSTSLFLTAGEEVALDVRVLTDATKQIGTASIELSAATPPFRGTAELAVYNGSPAVLFVDADNNVDRGLETPYVAALSSLELLYETIVAEGAGRGPSAERMIDYDLVLWETGLLVANAINEPSGEALTDYLGAGGSLYLNCQGFTAAPGNTGPLRTALGVAFTESNIGALEANGSTGDPITDDFAAELSWPEPAENLVDRIDPSSGATILRSETETSIAVRNESGVGRSVLSGLELGAMNESDAEEFVTRVLAWLLGEEVASIPDPFGTDEIGFPNEPAGPRNTENREALGVASMTASPNPTGTRSELSVVLFSSRAPRAANAPRHLVAETPRPVALEIFDSTGRKVSTVFRGQLEDGAHSFVWDGKDSGGTITEAGVYFAVLTHPGETQIAKLIRIASR